MKRLKVVACVLVATVALISAGSVSSTYRVQESVSHAQLLWRSEEAFLVIGVKKLGWRGSYIGLAGDLVLALFGLGSSPSEVIHSIALVRITAAGVERHIVDADRDIGSFGVIDNRITNGRSRWKGDRLEPATPDEQREWSAHQHAYKFPNADGWSNHAFLPPTAPPEGSTIAFVVGGQSAALKLVGTALVWGAIDLQRRNQPAERLWSLDQRLRWFVSKSEYDAIFKH